MSADQRLKLVVRAMSSMRKRYSWHRVPQLFLQSFYGYWRPVQLQSGSPATICSEVFANAYEFATGQLLCQPDLVVKPADLSQAPKLVDVELCWLQIAPG